MEREGDNFNHVRPGAIHTKHATFVAVAAALALLGGAAFAQGTPMVTGTVEKIDDAQGKLTINHQKSPSWF